MKGFFEKNKYRLISLCSVAGVVLIWELVTDFAYDVAGTGEGARNLYIQAYRRSKS